MATSKEEIQLRNSLKPAPTQADLEAKIKTWNFTSGDALDYNRMTWNKQWARQVALWSKEAVTTWWLKTAVTPDEIANMKSQWITKVDKNDITLDKTWLTPQEYESDKQKALNQAVWQSLWTEKPTETPKIEPTKVETKKEDIKPTTTTDITYTEDKQAFDPNKVISRAEQYTWADWKTYQTVRNSDNTLTTIDVTTWQPVTSKYTDAERENIKQSFLWWKKVEEIKKTSNDYYSMLWQGLDIPIKEKNTIEYKKAYQRKANLDKFSVMNSTQLAWAIKNWEFLSWTQEYNDLKQSNPKLVQDAETLHSINAINEDKKDATDIRVKISEYLTKLMSDDDKTSYKDKLSQNPNIVKLNESLWEKEKELASIKDSLEYAKEDLDTQLWWKAVTSWYKRYKLGEINRELTRQYNLVLSDYNSIAWQIKTISEDIKYEMESERQAEQDKLNQLWTAYNIYQWLTEWERQIEQFKNQRLYQTWDINSTDPYLQNLGIENAVNQLYTQYPIPWMEAPAVKIQKVKDLMAKWYTPQQAISQLEQEIRSTDRYKTMITPKITQTQDWAKLDDKTLYNQKTWETKTITWTSTAPTSVNVTPTWNYANLNYKNASWTTKSIKVDSIWKDSLLTALNKIWNSLVVWDSYRDSARQQALYDELSAKWAKVAKPWTSKHETWMAIDLYSDNNYSPLKPEQVAIMNANWWYQTAWEDDLWHFEYLWTKKDWKLADLWQYLKDNQERWTWYSEADVTAFNEKIDRFVKNGDENWMVLAFRKNLMWDKDFKQEFDNTQKFTKALDDVTAMINDYEKAGKSTNALKAMAEKVARKIWVTTDTALAQLQTQMWFTLANYIRSISWTAASDVEVQRLMGNMASIWNVKDLNMALVWQAKNNATSSLKSMIDTRLYWLPEDLKTKVFWDIYKWEESWNTTEYNWFVLPK